MIESKQGAWQFLGEKIEQEEGCKTGLCAELDTLERYGAVDASVVADMRDDITLGKFAEEVVSGDWWIFIDTPHAWESRVLTCYLLALTADQDFTSLTT